MEYKEKRLERRLQASLRAVPATVRSMNERQALMASRGVAMVIVMPFSGVVLALCRGQKFSVG